jgi:hypothetical protein
VTAYPGGADELASRALQGSLSDAAATVPAGTRGAVVKATADAYTSGLHTTLWIVAAACAVSAVVVGALLSGTRQTEEPAPAAEEAAEPTAVGTGAAR